MSGHRRYSSFLILLLVAPSLCGCQLRESGKHAWNPFRRHTTESAETQKESALSLPKFARRKESDSSELDADQHPIAEELVDRLLEQGQLALQEGRLEDARKAYSQVLDSSPDNATAHHGMAMASDLSEQWADAEYHYRQALRIRPRDANLLCDIGYSYLLQNRYSEASRYLNHAIEVSPQHESAQMNLALLDLRQGNRPAAENRIVARYGRSGEATQVLAQLERQMNNSPPAHPAESPIVIPENASFEHIQELARQERVEAERKRATNGVPQENLAARDNFAPVDAVPPVVVRSNQSLSSQGESIDPRSGLPLQPLNQPAPQVNAESVAQPNIQAGPIPGSMPGQEFSPQQTPQGGLVSAPQPYFKTAQGSPEPHLPAYYGEQPGNGVSPHATISAPPSAQIYDPFRTADNSPRSMNATNSVAYAMPSPSQSSAGLQENYQAPPASTSPQLMNAAPSAFPWNLPGRVIPVYPSGAFQNSSSGSISYGQPVGFAPAAGTGQQPISTVSATSAVNNPGIQGSSNTAAVQPQNPAPNSLPGFGPSTANMPPSSSMAGQIQGPGTMMPGGQQPLQPGQTSRNPVGQPTGPGSPNINMNNISSPGTNSLINGTYYNQPSSALPSQDWANQQQQQLRAQQLQSQQWQSRQSPGYVPSQDGRNNSPSAASGNGPAAPQTPVNSLQSYDRQRQQLDSAYNRSLQQMDSQNASGIPQFR